MNSKTLSNIFKGDKVIWMVFFFLCVISVIEVFSASSELTYKGGNYMAPILRHIGLLFLGIASMVVTLNIQCKYFKIITPFLLLGSILLLLIVWVTGNATNGASRWIGIMGFQFQPSEFAKGALVLATAQILSAMQTENGADKHALKYILLIWGAVATLFYRELLYSCPIVGSGIHDDDNWTSAWQAIRHNLGISCWIHGRCLVSNLDYRYRPVGVRKQECTDRASRQSERKCWQRQKDIAPYGHMEVENKQILGS